MIEYKDGEIIIEQGSDSTGFFVIYSGQVRVIHTLSNGEVAEERAILDKMEYFGGK